MDGEAASSGFVVAEEESAGEARRTRRALELLRRGGGAGGAGVSAAARQLEYIHLRALRLLGALPWRPQDLQGDARACAAAALQV